MGLAYKARTIENNITAIANQSHSLVVDETKKKGRNSTGPAACTQ